MPGIEIIANREYLYVRGTPVECHGHRYRVIDPAVLHEPSKQYLVFVEALTGPHAGVRFCCSPDNFRRRYEPAPVEAVPEKAAGKTEAGSGA